MNLYALIMAGGGGTRLWPLSRKSRPKQMLPLVEDRTMFEVSVERLDPLIPPERIFVVTGREQVEQLIACAPQVPKENFVVEPFGRDSGPAAALGIMHIRQRDPNAVIAILGADYHIADTAKFQRVLTSAGELAEQHYIVTLGVSPAYPSTGFGYIKRGEPLCTLCEFQAYLSEGFTEKPDSQTAVEFVLSGLYSWNSGMFICTADQIVSELTRQQPVMSAQFEEIARCIGTPCYDETISRIWPEIQRISLDYAVMEKAERMAVIPVDMGWSDIGSWAALYEVLGGDLDGNIARGNGQGHVQIDTKQTLVISNRMVVTIGIEDIVIVDTDDVLLVCNRDRTQDVRQVVKQLKDKGQDIYL